MRRWLTPAELGDQLAQRSERVARLNKKRRREYAVRVVQRIERLEQTTLTKRLAGGRILVSWKAVEVLNPPDMATVDLLDKNVAQLSQAYRGLKSQAGAHGSHIRDHSRRLVLLEEKEAARRRFEAEIHSIESRGRAAS